MKKRSVRLIICSVIISMLMASASGITYAAANVSPKIEYISHTVYKPGKGSNQKVKISWNAVKTNAKVEILNSSKKSVKVLWNHKVSKKGSKIVSWDGTNEYKAKCSNGTYYIRFTLNNKKVQQSFKLDSKAGATASGYGKAFLTYGTIGFPSDAKVYSSGSTFSAKDTKSTVLIESGMYSFKNYKISDDKILYCFTEQIISDWGIKGLKATNTKIMGIKAKQVSFTSKGKKFVDIYFAKNRNVYSLEMSFSASNKSAAGVVNQVKKLMKVNKTKMPKGGREVIINPSQFSIGELAFKIPQDYSLIKNNALNPSWTVMKGNPFRRSSNESIYSYSYMMIDSVGVNVTKMSIRDILDEYVQGSYFVGYPGVSIENKDKQLNKGEMVTTTISLTESSLGLSLKYYENNSLIETDTKHLYRVNFIDMVEGSGKSNVSGYNSIVDSVTVK